MYVAITGGIGMGKTTVLKDFAELGCAVIDADDIAHELYEPGAKAYTAMVEHFGESILDASRRINRKAVGARVFGHAEELSWLNGMLHPLIREEISRVTSGTTEPVYAAVPLLFESGWEADAAVIVAVWCDAATQRERLHGRGWNDDEIARRIGAQISADDKLKRADYGIMTGCSWEQLREQCQRVHEKILMRRPAERRQ